MIPPVERVQGRRETLKLGADGCAQGVENFRADGRLKPVPVNRFVPQQNREEASVEGDVAGGFVGRAVVETVDDVRGGGDQRALLVGERRVPFVRIVLIVRVVVITRSVLVVVITRIIVSGFALLDSLRDVLDIHLR